MEGLDLFSIVRLLIGGYLVYIAIRATGPIFQNDYLKCTIEAYNKVMRPLCATAGGIVIVGSVLDLMGIGALNTSVGRVLWGAGLMVVIGMLVYPLRVTDRRAAAMGKRTSRHENEPVPQPFRAAFEFDEPGQGGKAKKGR